VAYPRKTRNKPAKRHASDARFLAAHPQFKRDLNWTTLESQKQSASLVGYRSRTFLTRGPKQGYSHVPDAKELDVVVELAVDVTANGDGGSTRDARSTAP